MPDDRLYTVAQLARRVGLSDGRVRAMWAKTPDRMPVPDEFDADGHPLWRAPTVDRWDRLRKMSRAADVARALLGAEPSDADVERILSMPFGELLRGRELEAAGGAVVAATHPARTSATPTGCGCRTEGHSASPSSTPIASSVPSGRPASSSGG